MSENAPAKPLRASVPVVGMLKLLQDRKAALEAMVAERFRQASEKHSAADVKQLSATLRAVKRSLAAAMGRNG
jgi:hypothetical protein